jgi:hypothetical protein
MLVQSRPAPALPVGPGEILYSDSKVFSEN